MTSRTGTHPAEVEADLRRDVFQPDATEQRRAGSRAEPAGAADRARR